MALRSPSGRSSDHRGAGTSSAARDAPGVSGVEVGERVIAKWVADRRWYVATVKSKTKWR